MSGLIQPSLWAQPSSSWSDRTDEASNLLTQDRHSAEREDRRELGFAGHVDDIGSSWVDADVCEANKLPSPSFGEQNFQSHDRILRNGRPDQVDHIPHARRMRYVRSRTQEIFNIKIAVSLSYGPNLRLLLSRFYNGALFPSQ